MKFAQYDCDDDDDRDCNCGYNDDDEDDNLFFVLAETNVQRCFSKVREKEARTEMLYKRLYAPALARTWPRGANTISV